MSTTETPPIGSNTTSSTNGDGAKLLKEIVPAEYHDKPYMKDFLDKPQTAETYADLFKKFDGAQQLIGKKTLIPETDDEQQWKDFTGKLRPATAAEYEIKGTEGQTPDPEFTKMLQEAFHEAGLSKYQAKMIQGKWLEKVNAQTAEVTAAQKKADEEFNTLVQTTFGAEGEKVLSAAQSALKEHTPENLKAHLEKLDNTALTIMAGVITSILKKYTAEDDIDPKASDVAGGGEDLREEGKRLMASEAYKDSFHKDHEKTAKRVVEIYEQLGKKGVKT